MNSRLYQLIISLLIIHVFISCQDDIKTESLDILDSFTGNYLCEITSRCVNTNTWVVTYDTFSDTVKVTKVINDIENNDPTGLYKLQISGLKWGSYRCDNIVEFDINDSSFLNIGDRVYGRFFYDSVYVHTQISPAAIASGTYLGKKIIN